jgi:hypothetical protein
MAKPIPNPHCRNSIPSGLVQHTKLNKKAPPVAFKGGARQETREL